MWEARILGTLVLIWLLSVACSPALQEPALETAPVDVQPTGTSSVATTVPEATAGMAGNAAVEVVPADGATGENERDNRPRR